jgi:hypothetical protein
LVNAHVQKIFALSRLADDAADTEAAWKKVRRATTALNKVETDHPIPLIYYYRSLQSSGKDITPIAVQGLERAVELAPYDKNVRWMLVQQLINDEAWAYAYRTLMPLANDPHNRNDENPAIKLLAELKDKIDAAKPVTSETAAKP